MKRLIAASLVAAAFASGHAQAGNTTSNFDVTVNLTSGCSIGAITALDFTYTAYQPGAQPATGGGFNVSCTNGLSYNFGLVSGAGGAAPGAASINPTTLGLNYTLNIPAGGPFVGTGANQAYTLTGSMGANQGGTCAGASCSTTVQHTLVVNF